MRVILPRWEAFCEANPGLVAIVYLSFYGASFVFLWWNIVRLAARVASLEACE